MTTESTTYSAGTVVTSDWLNAIDASIFDDVANVKRYGATGDGVTDDTQAFIDAIAAKRFVFVPSGTYVISSTLTIGTLGQIIRGAGDSTILSYTGANVAIDLNGKYYCELADFKLTTSTGAVGVDMPISSHFWQINKLHVYGFSTAGIRGTSCFYGTLQRSDIEQCGAGFLGVQEVNGNFIVNNSFRGNIRNIWLRQQGFTCDGNQIVNNELETSGRAGFLVGIDLEGSYGTLVFSNRLECGHAGGTAHILVRGATLAASNNNISGNYFAANAELVAPIVIGVGAGTGVNGTIVSDNTCLAADASGFSIVVASDARYTTVRANRRNLGDGVYNISNAGTATCLDFSDDSGFTVGITGLTTTPTAQWRYQIATGIVTLYTQTLNGISNTTACTLTGLPPLIRPTNSQTVLITVQENGTIQSGKGVIDNSGVITLSSTVAGGAFTASGSKGFIGCVITYPLN